MRLVHYHGQVSSVDASRCLSSGFGDAALLGSSLSFVGHHGDGRVEIIPEGLH